VSDYQKETWENLYRETREAMDGVRASRDELNQKSADFLKVDVETALTFSEIAIQTFDPAKKQRNRKHARKGYDTILRFMSKVSLGDEDTDFLAERMQELKSNLQNLGEVF
jgi:hypothetical protein